MNLINLFKLVHTYMHTVDNWISIYQIVFESADVAKTGRFLGWIAALCAYL
jgi:hypothetical protein